MNHLVIAEHDGEILKDATHKTVSAALLAGGDVDILVAGENLDPISTQAAKIANVRTVYTCEDKALAHHLAEAMQAAIVPLMENYDAVWAADTTNGKNFMPRIAAALDVMQISSISAVESADTFIRPIYAGNAMAKVKSSDAKKVITVRPTSFEAQDETGNAEIKAVTLGKYEAKSVFVSEDLSVSDRPELTAARIVISGGRGMGSGENFALIEGLADKMGAAVGASRAAVDAGFVPNDYQVGQTGKVVAPDLYVAIGISGAIQHLAGMKDSKIIVAINKDEDAPIFQISDYGYVVDLFKAIPELLEALG